MGLTQRWVATCEVEDCLSVFVSLDSSASKSDFREELKEAEWAISLFYTEDTYCPIHRYVPFLPEEDDV